MDHVLKLIWAVHALIQCPSALLLICSGAIEPTNPSNANPNPSISLPAAANSRLYSLPRVRSSASRPSLSLLLVFPPSFPFPTMKSSDSKGTSGGSSAAAAERRVPGGRVLPRPLQAAKRCVPSVSTLRIYLLNLPSASSPPW
jgi:hypothetical protein